MNTPIEELIYYLKTQGFYLMDSERKKYLEKEKQVIIEAYNQCSESLISGDAEQYYNETFKK
jgi:hypothetical protein